MQRPLTLAQVLTLFYVIVIQANEHNKKHNPTYQLGEYYLRCLKKELHLMSSNNDYMNIHINTPITLMHSMLRENDRFWIEDFISRFICQKHSTLYLTYEMWNEIKSCLIETPAFITPPFRKGQLTFF